MFLDLPPILKSFRVHVGSVRNTIKASDRLYLQYVHPRDGAHNRRQGTGPLLWSGRMNILQIIKEKIEKRQRLVEAQMLPITVYRGVPYKRSK